MLIKSRSVSPGRYSFRSGMISRSLKRKLAPVESLPGDREQVAALDDVSLAVVDRRRQPVLAGGRRLDRLTSLTFGVQSQVPALHGCLDRPALGIVGDLEQLERPLADDRLVVEGLRAILASIMSPRDNGRDRPRYTR